MFRRTTGENIKIPQLSAQTMLLLRLIQFTIGLGGKAISVDGSVGGVNSKAADAFSC